MINCVRTSLFAGVLLAMSAQAAQKVNISFPFRTPAGELPAGKYLVEFRNTASAKLVQLTNMDTKSSVLFLPEVTISSTRSSDPSRLTFSCVEKSCNLSEIWPDSELGYAIRQKRTSAAEAERLTVVLRTQPATAE